MKSLNFTKYFLTAWFLFGLASVIAQTVPGSAFPTAGMVFRLTETDTTGVEPGSGGTGVTWNFASLTANGSIRIDSFMNASATPHGAVFPSATVALHEIVPPLTNYFVYYYNNTASGIYQRIGNIADSAHADTVIYTTPADEFPYPLTPTTVFGGDYYAHYLTSGGSATEAGVISGGIDGTGTLVLPTGTYTNVLRSHLRRTENDTVYTPGPEALLQIDDYYEWYQPNSYFPILSIESSSYSLMGFTVFAYKTVGYRAGYTSSTPVPPTAVNDTASVTQPGSVTINVLANDINNNPGDTDCVTGVWGTPSGWETVHGCSDVVFQALDTTFTGPDTFYYRSCDTHYPTLCDTGMVVVDVLPAPVVLPFQAGFIATGGECGTDLLINASDSATSFTWYLSEAYPGSFDTAINNIDTLIPYNIDPQFQNATYYICITARAGGNDTVQICDTIQFICLGINEITTSEYKIYPNPAYDLIQLDLSHMDQSAMASLSEIVVYDMAGQKLKVQSISQTAISVGDLCDGVYMIGVVDKSENVKVLGKFEVLR